jgi:uncharacterized protein YggU (UPF0235/DUF167 family)
MRLKPQIGLTLLGELCPFGKEWHQEAGGGNTFCLSALLQVAIFALPLPATSCPRSLRRFLLRFIRHPQKRSLAVATGQKDSNPNGQVRPANQAVVSILAETLGIDADAIQIESGHSSPSKMIAITGIGSIHDERLTSFTRPIPRPPSPSSCQRNHSLPGFPNCGPPARRQPGSIPGAWPSFSCGRRVALCGMRPCSDYRSASSCSGRVHPTASASGPGLCRHRHSSSGWPSRAYSRSIRAPSL